MISRTNYCAECEQHAREVARLRRIIMAWEDERIWLAWDDYRGAKQLRTLTADKCRVLRHNTPAEAYAALEKDGE